MKISLLLLAGISLLSIPLHGAEYLIVCSGQSNMAGTGHSEQLSDEYKAVPPNVLYFHQFNLKQPAAPLTTFADTVKFGPVPSFACTLAKAHPNDKFIVLLDAANGSNLMKWVTDYGPEEYLTWTSQKGNVVHEKPGSLYALMAQRIALLRKTYPEAKALAFLWLQGEADTGKYAGIYLDNFKRLAANIRKETGNPNLLILTGDPGIADEAIYAAFATFAKTDPHAATVPGRDLNHGQLHYNAKGYEEIGRRFAAALEARFTPGNGK